MTEISDVRYARSADGIDIAYQTVGSGPIDLVFVSGFVSHLDLLWDIPSFSSAFHALAEHCRVILFDKRGTGLSDRSLGFGSAADRMDDIRTVADAAGVERCALYGVSEGGPLSILFAATYPERVSKLILYGTFAGRIATHNEDEIERGLDLMNRFWGTGHVFRYFIQNAPDSALPFLARYERSACTPQMVDEIMRKNYELDVRDILPTIDVPTLVLHCTGDPVLPVEHGRYLAQHIPGAELVEIDAAYHADWNDMGVLTGQELAFLTGEDSAPATDRVLATVLFTDIVSSTQRDAELGDRRWGELLNHHDRIVRNYVSRYRGRLIKSTGDGVLATFDGPARGIQCAQHIARDVKALGIEVRAGVHTGEVEHRGDDISGLGVVIARRVCDLAGDGELLASRTVKDLVTGSGISFADRGSHTLKGVPDDWQLFVVTA